MTESSRLPGIGLFDPLGPLEPDQSVVDRLDQIAQVAPAIAARLSQAVEAGHDLKVLPPSAQEAVDQANLDFERNNLVDALVVVGSIAEVRRLRQVESQGTLF